MDTFEYLNLLQLHGFPKVMGVLTNLDKFKLNKALQKTKKTLKQRFWTEIYKGAKMFEFTGVTNGKYLKHEVKRLSLYVSRVKFRPLVWRNTHPFVVVDRVEDITPHAAITADPSCDRDVALFGYVRGTHLKPSTSVHLIGVGDFDITSASAIEDPCPLPGQTEKLSLKTKGSLLHAPLANIGKVKMDQDGTYIDLKNVNYTRPDLLFSTDPSELRSSTAEYKKSVKMAGFEDTPVGLLRSMQSQSQSSGNSNGNMGLGMGMERGIQESSLSLFAGSVAKMGMEVEDDWGKEDEDNSEEEDDDNEEEDDEDLESDNDEEDDMEEQQQEEEDNDSNDDGDGDIFTGHLTKTHNHSNVNVTGKGVEWKGGMVEKAARAYHERSSAAGRAGDLMQLSASQTQKYKDLNATDSSRCHLDSEAMAMWMPAVTGIVRGTGKVLRGTGGGGGGMFGDIRNKFVTGDWTKANLVSGTGSENQCREERESQRQTTTTGTEKDVEVEVEDDDAEDGDGGNNIDNDDDDEEGGSGGGGRRSKGKGKVSQEDREEEVMLEAAQRRLQEQNLRNKEEFGDDGDHARLQLEGLRQGLYCRVVIRGVAKEFTQGFRPRLPVVLGGLLPHESAVGIVRARVKRHRWHKRILKSNDPLIFSVGWRRFQSLPSFAIEDPNDRIRFLKYTPEHMHCYCHFYGPLVPPNTGILAYQKASRSSGGFRISLTGTALELSSGSEIVKKLKLVGTPSKIFKNTAFITGMFNSELEVAKFEGAKLKTVSGIRGQIKKPIREGAPGSFRATFEDKILMSDIVICRMWVPAERETEGLGDWQGMRPLAQIRRDQSIPLKTNKDSVYKPIVRTPREFRKMVVPKKLQAALPFASKPKLQTPKNKDTYMSQRAVVLEPEDRKRRAAVQVLSTIAADKAQKKKTSQKERGAERTVKLRAMADKFADVHRETRKRKHARAGMETASREMKRQRG
eukprot:gene2831-5563_t